MIHHAAKQRAEFGCAQRPARDIGEHLDAARAKLRDGAVDFRHRGIEVVHGERGNEGGKTIGVTAAQLRQRIVGNARERRRDIRRGDQLQRWIGERKDLLDVTELVEQPQAHSDIDERGQPRKCGDRNVVRDEGRQPLQVSLGHEMIEDVDNHCVLDAWRRLVLP